MGAQFEEIIKPRMAKVNKEVAPGVASAIAEQMKRNSQAGTAFGNDEYESSYKSDSHKARRRKIGLQTQTVTMRMDSRRIEKTKVEKVGGGKRGAIVAFEDPEAGVIFNYHHKGTTYGHTRSLFPKSVNSIPDKIKADAMKNVAEVLRGKK